LSDQGCRPWSIHRGEPGYPAALLDLGADAPRRLFGCGHRAALGGLELGHTVTIVGSRRASSYGLQVAEELGRLLAAAGLVVVSGMARGIDAAAHRGALAGGGTTIAVLGGGADVVYPTSERRLYRDILASGATISEAAPGQRPEAGSFPKRNRIMAALGAITVVVEAAQPSGSLITARQALKLQREVGAIPGLVTSRVSEGTNDLIVDGAALVRGAQDVLDRLLGVGIEAVRRCGPPLEPDLARVAEAVELGGSTCDAVAVAVEAPPQKTAIALARLELLGYVRADAGGRYARTPLVMPGGEAAQ
jgi:DNA processing protein